jgi:hypothetical protein
MRRDSTHIISADRRGVTGVPRCYPDMSLVLPQPTSKMPAGSTLIGALALAAALLATAAAADGVCGSTCLGSQDCAGQCSYCFKDPKGKTAPYTSVCQPPPDAQCGKSCEFNFECQKNVSVHDSNCTSCIYADGYNACGVPSCGTICGSNKDCAGLCGECTGATGGTYGACTGPSVCGKRCGIDPLPPGFAVCSGECGECVYPDVGIATGYCRQGSLPTTCGQDCSDNTGCGGKCPRCVFSPLGNTCGPSVAPPPPPGGACGRDCKAHSDCGGDCTHCSHGKCQKKW